MCVFLYDMVIDLLSWAREREMGGGHFSSVLGVVIGCASICRMEMWDLHRHVYWSTVLWNNWNSSAAACLACNLCVKHCKKWARKLCPNVMHEEDTMNSSDVLMTLERWLCEITNFVCQAFGGVYWTRLEMVFHWFAWYLDLFSLKP